MENTENTKNMEDMENIKNTENTENMKNTESMDDMEDRIDLEYGKYIEDFHRNKVEDISFREREKILKGEVEWNRDELLDFVKKYGFVPLVAIRNTNAISPETRRLPVNESSLEYIGKKVFKENREDILQHITYNVVGLRKEEYKNPQSGSNGEYSYKDIICCTKGGKKYEITLTTDVYEEKSTGEMLISEVEEFGNITHLPQERESFELVIGTDGTFRSKAFTYDPYGGISWSSHGYAGANYDFFVERSKIVEQNQDYLTDKSPEELEEILNVIEKGNESKKAKVEGNVDERKQNLINEIKKAQAESDRLDKILNDLNRDSRMTEEK